MNNVVFGRYTPYNTFIHKMDPRDKVVILILLIVAVFLRFNLWSTNLIISGFMLIFLAIIMLISKCSFLSLLKSLLGMWFLILFLLVVYILVPNQTYSHVAFTINNFKVYWDAFYQCGYIILRILMMIGLTMVLTSTTKPMDLTYGLEWYMTPLKVIKFPAHIIAMIISIALRFIPTLLEETNRIMKAQESRGADFSRGRLFHRLKALTALIVPLLVSAFQRSDELADAMEARGYDPNGKRTRYRKLTFTYRDIVGSLIGIGVFAGVLTLFIFDKTNANLDLIYEFSSWFNNPVVVGW